MKQLFIFIIKVYRFFISPILVSLFGMGCRYSPTCSEYVIKAIGDYGVIEGSQLGVRRLLSCNPFSKKDIFDPVPVKL